jgi:hypothetical protein
MGMISSLAVSRTAPMIHENRKPRAIAIAATATRNEERARLRHLGIGCLYAVSALAALAFGLLA